MRKCDIAEGAQPFVRGRVLREITLINMKNINYLPALIHKHESP